MPEPKLDNKIKELTMQIPEILSFIYLAVFTISASVAMLSSVFTVLCQGDPGETICVILVYSWILTIILMLIPFIIWLVDVIF